MTGAQTRRFLLDASQKVFRAKKRCCAASSDPAPGLDGRMYGGALVMVHPHYTGRIVARFSDNRGLGRYAALTLRGKNGTLMTFISVYLTPALSGENGQAAAQQRYIDNHPGTLSTHDPYELAVRDIAELVSDRHRAGSTVVLGGDLQTDVADGSKARSQLIQKYWGRKNLILPSLDMESQPWAHGPQATRPPTYYEGDAAT